MDYGNPQVKILSNTRPVRPPVVIAGDMGYPSLEEIKKIALELASDVWFIDATEKAVKMGNPILGNIIMLGALSGVTNLPLDKGDFKEVISKSMAGDKIDINLKAYDLGEQIVKQA
jgi:indolepyruvate ferredoxin oxidoreductase beta subunit